MLPGAYLAAAIVLVCCLLKETDADALHPVRYGTEQDFFRANTHERTESIEQMEEKISAIRARRKFQPWNASNPIVAESIKTKRPNILFILADDLGYGDLSVEPFTTKYDRSQWPCVEGGILTPNLEKMAANGAILTNFHAAAPVCSPSRVAIMTGLYSWRLNAMNAFEVSKEDLTQLNGFLPQVPTVAEFLREAGYFTAHSGKWHIGGMREENRRARAQGDDCTIPGPNQHGFEEYVSALDGPESPRYSFLNRQPGGLHVIGHRHRIRNDVPMPPLEQPDFVLSDYEADDAIEMMKLARDRYPGQPWFIQVWFNAPHGPWERLSPGERVYNAHYGKTHEDWDRTRCRGPRGNLDSLMNNRWFYKTMVSAMDRSIGRLLSALHTLGVHQDTLVVFTSDNGAEWNTGTGGDFREGKRSLLEGGVRVPLVVQWPGVIPPQSYSPVFAAHTDLLPTFLDAARVDSARIPHRFDGISLLPVLRTAHSTPSPQTSLHDHRLVPDHAGTHALLMHEHSLKRVYFPAAHAAGGGGGGGTNQSRGGTLSPPAGDDASSPLVPTGRVHLWHKATDPYGHDARRQSGGFYEHVKVLVSHDDCVDRVFDLRYDPTEAANLLGGHGPASARCVLHLHTATPAGIHAALSSQFAAEHCRAMGGAKARQGAGDDGAGEAADKCPARYAAHLAKKVAVLLAKLGPFVRHGKQAWQNYMDRDARHAVCAVPTAAQAKALRYTDGADCGQAKGECSQPDYPYIASPAA